MALLGLTACGSDQPLLRAGIVPGADIAFPAGVDCAEGTINAAGSSAQNNAMTAWIARYQQECTGATINYQPTGSGAGIEAFIGGQVVFAGSDAALAEGEEQQAANARCGQGPALNLPMVVGPIAVAYNLEGVEDLALSPETIAAIFSGEITSWDDPRVAVDNPGTVLPDTPVQSFHRSDSSGTTQNFVEFLSVTAPEIWTYEVAKSWPAPGGQGANGSQSVAQRVRSGNGAIGYMEASYAENSGLSVAAVRNGAGAYVGVTEESVGAALEAAEQVGQGDDLALAVDYDTEAPGAYPVVLVTYEIVCASGTAPENLDLLKSFLSYTASEEGQALMPRNGYTPLPDSLRERVHGIVGGLS